MLNGPNCSSPPASAAPGLAPPCPAELWPRVWRWRLLPIGTTLPTWARAPLPCPAIGHHWTGLSTRCCLVSRVCQ